MAPSLENIRFRLEHGPELFYGDDTDTHRQPAAPLYLLASIVGCVAVIIHPLGVRLFRRRRVGKEPHWVHVFHATAQLCAQGPWMLYGGWDEFLRLFVISRAVYSVYADSVFSSNVVL